MKRLTYVTEKGDILFHPEDLPDDEGMTITQLAEDGRFKALEIIAESLANYEQAEELGLLLRLPCRIGDIIYHNGYGFPCGCTVDSISLDSNGMVFHAKNHDGSTTMSFSENELGKSVFFSFEEAEAKLEEMRGEQYE